MKRILFGLGLTVFTVPVFALIYHGVAVVPDRLNAWVVTIETTAVYHTGDFGLTWEGINIPTIRDFFDVFFRDANTGWTCGQAGDIWRTTDGGITWLRVNLGGPKHAARIRFFDNEFGWAAGGDIVQLRSSDGGATWEQVFLSRPPFPLGDTAEFQGVWFVDRNHGWLVAGRWPMGDTFLGGQGLIARTREGGAGTSWEVVYRDTTYDFYDVFFADTLEGWVVGGDDRNFRAVVLHTTDGGNTWHEQSVPEGTKFLRALSFVNRNQGWACGRNGTIIYTSDGGANWVLQNSGADSTLFDIEFADSQYGMAAGNGMVVATTDGGVNWRVAMIGIKEERADRIAGVPILKCYGTPGRQVRISGAGFSRKERVVIFDGSGRRLYSAEVGPDGNDFVWDGRCENNRRAGTGVYFARLLAIPGVVSRFVLVPE